MLEVHRSILRGHPGSHSVGMSYWKKIHRCIIEITKVDFPFCPRLYILGDPKQVSHCDYVDFILTVIMIGRQVLMRGWKVAGSPSFQDWFFLEVGKVAAYEEIGM